MPVRLVLSLTTAPAALVVPTASPALAFHHVALPADACGRSPYAGGANPTTLKSLRTRNLQRD